MADTPDAPAALHDALDDATDPAAIVPIASTALSRSTDNPYAAILAVCARPRPALSFSSRAMTTDRAGLSSTVKATQRLLAAALCTT